MAEGSLPHDLFVARAGSRLACQNRAAVAKRVTCGRANEELQDRCPSKTMAAAGPGGRTAGCHVSIAQPGPFVVVLLSPAFSLGKRHLEFSQLSTPSGSLCVHARATWFSLFLVGFLATAEDAPAMAARIHDLAGGGLGSI